MLYWQIGKLLRENVLAGQRAEYGKQVVKQLAAKLTARYGKGWSHQHLRHCLRIAETIPDEQIVYALSRQ